MEGKKEFGFVEIGKVLLSTDEITPEWKYEVYVCVLVSKKDTNYRAYNIRQFSRGFPTKSGVFLNRMEFEWIRDTLAKEEQFHVKELNNLTDRYVWLEDRGHGSRIKVTTRRPNKRAHIFLERDAVARLIDVVNDFVLFQQEL